MNPATQYADPMSTETLFRLHSPFVERFLVRLGVPPDHVEDALQDVFLVVHRNGGYRPGVAKPTSYLAGIAVNAAHKHRRRQRVDKARHNNHADAELMPSAAPDPTRELQAQEDLERLQLALDRLPEDLRTTLVLADVEGESCISVAATLGLPVGTVYSRLHVARQKLQLALQVVDALRSRQRALAAPRRASGWGMLAWLGPWFDRSEAGQLLRAARTEPPATGMLEARLARHHALLEAGADLHVAAYAPPTASWLGLLGPAGVAAVAGVTAVGLVTATLLNSAPLQPMAAGAPSQPLAAAPASPLSAASMAPAVAAPAQLVPAPQPAPTPVAVPAPRLGLAAVAVSAAPHSEITRSPRTHERSTRERAPASASLDIPTSTTTASAATEPAPAPAPQPIAAPAAAEPRAPAPTTPSADTLIEMRELANAERLVTRDPAQALAIIRDLRMRFPISYLREERSYVEVMSLFKLGRRQEAIERGGSFLGNYPDGPYTRRVRRAVSGIEQ